MTHKLFIDYSTLSDKLVKLIEIWSEHFDIIIFSVERESNRLAYEERLIDLEIGADELLMRAENDYNKAVDLRYAFVVDTFNGDEERAVEHTAAIVCSHEPSIEFFRENGFFVLQPDWS